MVISDTVKHLTHLGAIRLFASSLAIAALCVESAPAVTIPGPLPAASGLISVITQYTNHFCEAAVAVAPWNRT
jgi:hypothetical protein